MDYDINKYKEILRQKGYKLTYQRKAILRIIIKFNMEHLSCDEIFSYINKDYPEIGIATIYRTLQLFERLNIVYKVDFGDGFSRYELNDGDGDHHHHHLICLNCGKVLEVQMDLLESLEKEIERSENFKIVDHSVKFYGYCKGCSDE